MPWSFPDTFHAIPLIVTANVADWKNDSELKTQFAIALGEGKNPFEAAISVFGKETNKALYASTNWINDPIVTQAKQEFAEVTDIPQKALDRDQYAAKILETAEERILFNGNEVYALDGKDRVAALKLYGEARGFINNKTEINNTINNSNRFMEIKFVEPEKKDNVKIIDASPSIEPENILENSPIKLKLVG